MYILGFVKPGNFVREKISYTSLIKSTHSNQKKKGDLRENFESAKKMPKTLGRDPSLKLKRPGKTLVKVLLS